MRRTPGGCVLIANDSGGSMRDAGTASQPLSTTADQDGRRVVDLAVGVLVLVPTSPALIFGWGPLPRLGVRGAAVHKPSMRISRDQFS